jgi:hypothetical protein
MQNTTFRTSHANVVRAPEPHAASNPNALLSRYKPLGASARTARQDHLPPGVGSSHKMALTDLPRLKKYADAFEAAGRKHGLPPALLAAIASRESRGGGPLNGQGRGDRGNGFGLMQVDKNHHTPRGGPHSPEHIDQAAGILEGLRNRMRQEHPDWTPAQQLRGAVAAYNVGADDVHTLERMDEGTTGDDYSNDVWARAQALAPHFGGTSGTTRSTGAGGLLRTGSEGAEVKALQKTLGTLGYDVGEADGRFDPRTEAAVKKFQARHGLEQDGVVGPRTRRALEKSRAEAPAPRDGFQSGPQRRTATPPLEALEKRTPAPHEDAIRVTGYLAGRPFELDVVPVGTDLHGNKEYLRPDAAAAWKRMKEAAARDGVKLELMDAFRSHATQIERRRKYGNSAARPGHSNHQQGISMDINPTPEAYEWLRKNSRRFGIIPGDQTPGDLDRLRNERQHFTYRPEHTLR